MRILAIVVKSIFLYVHKLWDIFLQVTYQGYIGNWSTKLLSLLFEIICFLKIRTKGIRRVRKKPNGYGNYVDKEAMIRPSRRKKKKTAIITCDIYKLHRRSGSHYVHYSTIKIISAFYDELCLNAPNVLCIRYLCQVSLRYLTVIGQGKCEKKNNTMRVHYSSGYTSDKKA